MTVDTTRPSPPYSGITRHAGKWLVKFRHRRQDVTIGHYETADKAAWAADFVRYMLYGPRPSAWPPRVVRPNGPPRAAPLDCLPILRQILCHQLLPAQILLRHLAEYDARADADREGVLKSRSDW